MTAPKSALSDPDSPSKPEGSARHSLRVRTRLRHRPDAHYACMCATWDRGSSASAWTRIMSRMPRGRSRAEELLGFAACSCSAPPCGISPGPDGCAAFTTFSVSASRKRRPRFSPLSMLLRLLGILVRQGPAPWAGRPVAPSSIKIWRCRYTAASAYLVSCQFPLGACFRDLLTDSERLRWSVCAWQGHLGLVLLYF